VPDEVIVVGPIRCAVAVLVAVAVAGCGGDGGTATKASCGNRLTEAAEQPGIGLVDLSGCDLSGRKLAGLAMNHWDLSGARLVGADLTGSRFDSADLSGADLSRANLTGVRLAFTKLRSATFDGARFDHAALSGVDLAGAVLKEVSFRATQLTRVSFAGGTLDDVDLTDAVLTDVDLTGALLRGVDLTGARTEGVDLAGAGLERVTLKGTNLAGAAGLSDDTLARAFQVAPARLAQALADAEISLEGQGDIGSAVRGVCRGTPIPDTVRGISTPPRIALVKGKEEWTVAGERQVAASRFVDVVVCAGPIASRKVGRCGPYTGLRGYYDTYAESATLRLVDPRTLASSSVTVASDPPEECPTIIADYTYLGHLDLGQFEEYWVPQADRFARKHQG
jgi:uncharacterized protein YjbI with pentapeptide repeats